MSKSYLFLTSQLCRPLFRARTCLYRENQTMTGIVVKHSVSDAVKILDQKEGFIL